MNFVQLKDSLLLFVSQWVGTTAPRLVTAFVGLLLIVLLIQALWDRRLRVVPAMFGILFGGALLAMALDTRVLHALAQLSAEARLRWSVGLLSAMVLGTTLEAIRRMRLQERYAILWVGAGMVTLVGALFPKTLAVIGVVFGTDYTTSILAVFFITVALVLFHYSLALSRSDVRESRLAQRCALLEDRLERLERRLGESVDPPAAETSPPALFVSARDVPPEKPGTEPRVRAVSGVRLVAISLIAASCLVVLWTGLRTPEPMLGDEVTHYFMLERQSRQLATPNFFAEIPVGWGAGPEIRRYPHVFGWHYLGALVHRASGGSFRAVQLWHTLFWLQLLAVGYLLARRRGGDRTRASILYLLLLASMPAAVMFAVVFYQDVPVAAQVLTAFYLLFCGRRRWALLFLMIALAIKETAYLFLPAFFVVWGYTLWKERASAGPARRRPWRPVAVSVVLAVFVVGSYTLAWAALLQRYAQSEFYPLVPIHKFLRSWQTRMPAHVGEAPSVATTAGPAPARAVAQIIANHPGDLRLPKNYVLFGGVLIWLVAGIGLAARAGRRLPPGAPPPGETTAWLWGIGLSYVLPAAYILRSAPDARFFLPAVPFLLLPLAEWAVRAPRVKLLLALATVLALLQVAAVQSKVHSLRGVSPALREAIAYLRANPPEPRTVFMYPEGNYRLFPSPHDWYLGYSLREFWRGDNDTRLAMLHRHRIGAIVVKKHLVADVDERITDLGVYPRYFVRDIERDGRFTKVFDNSQVSIHRVPPPH